MYGFKGLKIAVTFFYFPKMIKYIFNYQSNYKKKNIFFILVKIQKNHKFRFDNQQLMKIIVRVTIYA